MKTRTRLILPESKTADVRTHAYLDIFPSVLFSFMSFLWFLYAVIFIYEWFYFYWSVILIASYYAMLFLSLFYKKSHNKVNIQMKNNSFNPISIKNSYNYHKTSDEEYVVRNQIWKDWFYWEYLHKSLIIFSLLLMFIFMAHLVIFESSISISPLIEFFTIYAPIITAFSINIYLLVKEKREVFRSQNRFFFISRLSNELEITKLKNSLGWKDYYFQK